MKTTIDIPEKVLAETLRHTGARTKKAAILTAVQQFNRRRRLEELSQRLHGSMPHLMDQAGLKQMREDAKWEKLR